MLSSAIAAAEALPQASTVARSRQGDPQGSVRLVFAAGTGGEKVVGGVWHSALHRGWAAELWIGEDLEQVGTVTADREMAKAMLWQRRQRAAHAIRRN